VTLTSLSRRLTTRRSPVRSPLYSVLIGMSALAVLLQGLWAGLFIHEGRDFQQSWVDVHARGGEAAIALAALASIVAVFKLRSRRDLRIGSIALTVLLVVEAYLGGLIGDKPGMTIIHLPLALGVMALAVWLASRAAWPPTARAYRDVPYGGRHLPQVVGPPSRAGQPRAVTAVAREGFMEASADEEDPRHHEPGTIGHGTG